MVALPIYFYHYLFRGLSSCYTGLIRLRLHNIAFRISLSLAAVYAVLSKILKGL